MSSNAVRECSAYDDYCGCMCKEPYTDCPINPGGAKYVCHGCGISFPRASMRIVDEVHGWPLTCSTKCADVVLADPIYTHEDE